MHLNITGRNMEVTPALRDYAEEKVGKIDKYLHKITSAHVILAVEKYRHIAEVTIQAHGMTIKAQEETGDLYSSIDQVMDKIEIQARKLKDRITERNKSGAPDEAAPPVETPAPSAPRVVRSNSFDPRPMTVDEAALQLGLRTEQFLVFVEARSSRVNVLYRRADGDFGLIETV
jgi:putative sigma-54 modulation protein